MKRFLLILWQLPQVFLGELIFLFQKLFAFSEISRHELSSGNHTFLSSYATVYNIKQRNVIMGFSLGRRIFLYCNKDWFDGYSRNTLKRDEILRHEFGHCVQSLYLGWLYLIVIAIPSLLVTGVSSNMAELLYTERWADKISKNDKVYIL
jgi:hypothetical protein